MKKFFAAVFCTLLIVGTSFAQDATPVAAASEAVQAVADTAKAAAQVAAPEATPVAVPEAAAVAAPVTSDIVEGTIVNAPVVSQSSMAPIQSNCGCSGVPVIGPMVSAAPVVTPPATSACGCGAAPAPAPVSSCGCEASAAAPVCCQPRQRRQIVRGAVSNLRSRRTSCCN